MCEACGEPIADPLLVRVLGELLAVRRQFAELERKLTEPKPPAPEWLAPKEFALRLGRGPSISSTTTPTSSVSSGSARDRGRGCSSQRIRFLPAISGAIRLRARRQPARTGNRRPRPDDEHMTKTATTANRRYFSPAQAAAELNVSKSTVYRAVESGSLPAVRLTPLGSIRIPVEALQASPSSGSSSMPATGGRNKEPERATSASAGANHKEED